VPKNPPISIKRAAIKVVAVVAEIAITKPTSITKKPPSFSGVANKLPVLDLKIAPFEDI